MKTNNQKPETKKPKETVNTAKTASAASRMIFARNQVRSTDTRKTGLNNNVLVVGDNVIIGLSPSDFRKRGSHGDLVHICLRRQ